MLKRHDKHIHAAWVSLDIALAGLVFTVLLLQPELSSLRSGEEGLGQRDLLAVGSLAAVVLVGWPLCLIRAGVYLPQRREPLSQAAIRLLTADCLMAAIIAALAFLVEAPLAPEFPIALAGSLFALQVAIQLPARWVLRRLRRDGRNSRNLLVIGAGPRALEVKRIIDRHPEWGLRIWGFIDDGESGFTPAVPRRLVHKSIEVPRLLHERSIDEVLVACPRSMLEQIAILAEQCAESGIPVSLLTDLLGSQLPPPRVGSFGSVKALSFAPAHHDQLQLAIKRGFDVTASALGILVTAPVIALAALAVRVDSPGPVFHRQTRLGQYGRPFELLRLRTLRYAEPDGRQRGHLREARIDLLEDPRITRVGRWLRLGNVDELPRLWNVLRGDMSMVGPRPPLPEELLRYNVSDGRRLSMRPGLTCLWQVSGRGEVDLDEWMKLDLEYVDDWSLSSDVRILARTLPEGLGARGGP